MSARFALAPMNALIWVTTAIVLALPPVFAVVAVDTPPPVQAILLVTAAVLVAMYGVVYLWFRPREFVVGPDGLDLVWPMRQRRIPRSAIVGVRVVDWRELTRELGYVMRFGAGGLWGGFGLALTAKGKLELWVSRTDRIVWIQCEGRRSLLITPSDPERFARALAEK
jgi:hypothetical protein